MKQLEHRLQVSDLVSTKSMELETETPQNTPNKSPTSIKMTSTASSGGGSYSSVVNPPPGDNSSCPEESFSASSKDLFPGNHVPPNLSGSMGKLPSNSSEASSLDVVGDNLPKCRSTTPPAVNKARSRSHTWSQVKGLIIKNVRENRSKSKRHSTASYPASPGGGVGATSDNPSVSLNVIDSSEGLQTTSSTVPSSSGVSPSMSSSSSPSSSPPLSRPTNLPLNLDPPAIPVPPPRVKKKKSLLSFNTQATSSNSSHHHHYQKKSGKCVDLRSGGLGSGGPNYSGGQTGGSSGPSSFTSMMKKFRKNSPPASLSLYLR